MPLNAKGEEIKKNFEKEYGKKEGESNFYATVNAGKITGVDSASQCHIGKYFDNQRQGRRDASDIFMRDSARHIARQTRR